MFKPAFLTISLAAVTAFATTGALAHNPSFGKPIQADVVITKQLRGLTAGNSTKSVTLMNVKLTPEQLKHFTTFPRATNSLMASSSNPRIPTHMDLGMNHVPVLDQGRHGSCVTFATTAAVDALLNKGTLEDEYYQKADYVSQLCSLELGSYLETRAYTPSGWNGSWGPLIIEQILNFGVINKDNQKTKSCAGVNEYPLKDEDNEGAPMSLDEFKTMSEDLSQTLSWYPLLSGHERMQWELTSSVEGEKLLNKVKTTLATRLNNDDAVRITFGVLLPVTYGSAGATAIYHQRNDTWALTNAIKYDTTHYYGGHEMVIMGYDDKAVAVDNEGVKHTGLLHLRNSWGEEVGDAGDFYMTYDFFKQFVMEVQAIVTTHDPIQ